MIRRSGKFLFEFIVGLLAGLALLAGMAVWRLSAEPVPLDFLTPYLEEVFAKTRSGMTVEVGETLLTWAGWSRTFELRAREVRIRDAEGATIAILPDTSVTLSLRALLAGTIAPTEIEVIGARVSLNRDSDGRFRLASGPSSETPEAGSGAPEFSRIVPALADLFLREPDPSSPLGYLTAVRILEGKFLVDDRRLETVWFAPSADMELRRHDSGLAVFLGLKLALGEGLVDANLAVLYDDVRSRVDVAARVSGLQLGALAAVLPGLEFLEGVTVPVEANASAVFDTEGTFRNLKFDATGGGGEITLPGEQSEPMPVAGFDLRGSLDGQARRLEVEAFELRFGSAETAGPGLSGSLAVDGLGGDLEIVAEARLDELATNELEHYWPSGLSRGARKWVVGHIRDGTASDGSINLALQVPGGDFKALKIARLDGGFAYQGLTVHYIQGMPPITGGRGRATFDRSGLRFRIAGGHMDDLELTGGTVDVLGLDIKKPGLVIEGDVAGPLPQVLQVLNHEKLRLLKHIGIRPTESAGQVETHLTFRFPLIKGLRFKDVDVKADARIRQGAIASFLLGRDGTEMALDLEVSRQAMTVTGPLELAGVPVEIDWRQGFTAQAEPRTLLKLEIPTIDAAGRRNLGFDWAPFFEGPSSASVVVTVAHDRTGRVNVAADLTRAHLAFPFLSWEKPPGTEGRAHVTLSLVDGKVSAIERFDVEAGSLVARGWGELTPDGRNYRALHFDEMSFDGTKVRGASLARDGPVLVVDLGRGVVDAAAFFKSDSDAESGAAGGLEPEPEPEPEPKTPLRISASGLDSLYFAEGRYLQGVALDMERSTAGWEHVTIRGEVPRALWAGGRNGAAAAEEAGGDEARTFDLRFGPSGMGDYRLVINMNDMGAGLRALDAIDTVTGGNLVITGISPGPAPGYPIQGRIEAQDYTLVEAPVMAQLLSLSSLTGIANVLSGDGLEFDRLVGEFTLENGVMTTDLMRAYGGALGLTAKGSIDFRHKMIDLRGTIVPAYTVNRILGKIPILGRLLIGGEGEGIVAFIYEMKGLFGEPIVSVNPLSALTPGFLRGLFGVGSGSAEEGATQGEDAVAASRPRAFPTGTDR